MFYQIHSPKKSYFNFQLKIQSEKYIECNEYSITSYCQIVFLYDFLKIQNLEEYKALGFSVINNNLKRKYENCLAQLIAIKRYFTAEIIKAEVFATMHWLYLDNNKGDSVSDIISLEIQDIVFEYFDWFFQCFNCISRFATDEELLCFLSELMPVDFSESEKSKHLQNLQNKMLEALEISEESIKLYEAELKLYTMEWLSCEISQDKTTRLSTEKYKPYRDFLKEYYSQNNILQIQMM